MTFLAIMTALPGFFKFFDQVSSFIKLLEKTPEQKHQEIMQKVASAFDESANGGRPSGL